MEYCHVHPEREAIAHCRLCQAALCEECCAPGFEEATCFDCSIDEAGMSVVRKEKDEAAAVAPSGEENPPIFSKSVMVFLFFSLMILATETGLVLISPKNPSPPPQRHAGTKAEKLEKAAVAQTGADAILLKIQVEAFKKEHGAYPDDLSEAMASLPSEIRSNLQSHVSGYEKNSKNGYSLNLSTPQGQKMKITQEGFPIVMGE